MKCVYLCLHIDSESKKGLFYMRMVGRAHRNEVRTKRPLGLKAYIPFLTRSSKLWRQDKTEGVGAPRGSKVGK